MYSHQHPRRLFTNNTGARDGDKSNKLIFCQFSSSFSSSIKTQQGFLAGGVSEKPEDDAGSWLPNHHCHSTSFPGSRLTLGSSGCCSIQKTNGHIFWAVTDDNCFVMLVMSRFLNFLLLENLWLVSFLMICTNNSLAWY